MGDTIGFSVPDNFPIVYQEDHEALRPLRERGEVRLFSTRHGSPAELVERRRGARAVINVRAYSKFTDETFAALPDLGFLTVVTDQGIARMARHPVENVQAYLDGKPQFVVNPAVLAVAR